MYEEGGLLVAIVELEKEAAEICVGEYDEQDAAMVS